MRSSGQSASIQQAFHEFDRIEQLQNSGAFQDALQAAQTLVAKQPKWSYGHYSLGSSLALLNRYEEARKSLRKAISVKQGVGAFHAKLAEVLHRLDDIDGAMKEIDSAIALEPGEPAYKTSKAWMLRLSGENDRAFALLDELYAGGNRDHRMVRIYAGTLGQMGQPERAIEVLGPLANEEHPDAQVIAAHWYVLAHQYDKCARYDEAYSAATRGAELNAKTYDPRAREHIMNERLRAWSDESMPRLARSRVSSDKPVFIVGMPRSGTTLVEQIIAAHPQAYGGGELINIFAAAQELVTPTDASASIAELAEGLKPATLDRTARRILRDMEKQAPSGNKPERISDKLLLNFQHLGLIEQLFPNARVIVCQRHPLDTFISSYLLDFEGHNAHAYTDRPEWFAHFYALHLRYLEHYTRVCTLPIMEVRYEDIVEDQRGMTERLLAFLGLAFDESCMRFYEHKRAVITASTDQVRKRMYRGALARHTNYEAHLGPVREALQARGVPLN
jgi:Flp pilus assembly protein TadD